MRVLKNAPLEKVESVLSQHFPEFFNESVGTILNERRQTIAELLELFDKLPTVDIQQDINEMIRTDREDRERQLTAGLKC